MVPVHQIRTSSIIGFMGFWKVREKEFMINGRKETSIQRSPATGTDKPSKVPLIFVIAVIRRVFTLRPFIPQ